MKDKNILFVNYGDIVMEADDLLSRNSMISRYMNSVRGLMEEIDGAIEEYRDIDNYSSNLLINGSFKDGKRVRDLSYQEFADTNVKAFKELLDKVRSICDVKVTIRDESD